VFRDHGLAGANGILDGVLRVREHRVISARVLEVASRSVYPAAVDGDDAHAGDVVHDGVREPLAHETGAQNADTNRSASLGARPQCIVNDDHDSCRTEKGNAVAPATVV